MRLFYTIAKNYIKDQLEQRKNNILQVNPLPTMRKVLPACLALCLSYVFSFSQCLIPRASGDTIFPVTGNFYLDSSVAGLYFNTPTQIYNIVRAGNQYYVTGTFTHIGPNQGPGVVVDSASGAVVTSKAWRPNGFVRASVPDGQGGFYIAGDFTRIGSVVRSYLAQIDANGEPTAWAPVVNHPVFALYKRNDTLFAGGQFTAFANQPRNVFAAWSISGDSVLSQHLGVDSNGPVYAIVPYGAGKLFIGRGECGGCGNAILQYNIATQNVTTWAPPYPVYGDVQSIEMSSDDSTVYYTDQYTRMVYADDAVTGNEKFRISISLTGPPDDAASPHTLKRIGNTLYIGGNFLKVTDASGATYFRNGICAVNAATGVLKTFDPQLNNRSVSYLDAHGNDLIISGLFSKVGDSSRQYLALVDTGTYALDNWLPLPSDGVLTVSYSSGRVFVGGVFNGLQSLARNGLAGFDGTTGEVLPFNPTPTPYSTITWTKKMAVRGDTLFSLIKTNDLEAAQETDQLFLYSRSSGTQLATPNLLGSAIGDFIIDGNYLYAATDNYIRRFALPGLGQDASWTAYFNSGIASEPQALCQDSTTIYTVGDNRTNSGSVFPNSPYVQFSRIDKTNAANITTYVLYDSLGQTINPGLPAYGPLVNHAVLADSILFVQGRFHSLNGVAVRNLAAINVRSGNVLNWSPKPYGSTSFPYNYNQPFSGVMKFQASNGGIWYGWDWEYTDAVFSSPPPPFGAIDSTTGIFLPPPFTLVPGNTVFADDGESGQFTQNAVNDFLLDPDQSVVVGAFGEINGQPTRNIARLTYGTYTAPTASSSQTIAGPNKVAAGSDSVQYALADSLGYNWSYTGSNVTIVNNGQDPVLVSFASNATGGVLTATGAGYCGTTAANTQENIVVIQVTPAPNVNACCMVFTNTQTNRTSLSFSPGNGSGRLVVASTSPITAEPVLGTVYTASAGFGSGSNLGGGNFVTYAGSGDSLTVTGLLSTTKYYFAVFEYTVSNDTIKYQTGQAYSDSITTLALPPTIAPSNIRFSQVGTTSLTVSCTPGNGNGRIYLFKTADSIQALPQDGIAYPGNVNFSYGYAFPDDSYVVADTGAQINVKGLTPGTTYYVKIFEYSGTGSATDYLTSNYAADTATTVTPPSAPSVPQAPTVSASGITVTAVTTISASVSCTPGNGQNRLFVIRPADAVVDTPLTGHSYPANPTLGAGTNLGDSTFVVAATGTSVAITGLSPGTLYAIAVFESNGSGDSTVYMEHPFPSTTFTTAAAPPPTVNWQDSSFSVTFYPNPVQKDGQLRIKSNETSPMTIRLLTFSGGLVVEFSFAVTPGITTFDVPYLAGLPKGIYILDWRTKDQNGSVKLIKL